MGDSHAEWIAFGNVCRQGNNGCSGFNNTVPWFASGRGIGDWNSQIIYHWWFFPCASMSSN